MRLRGFLDNWLWYSIRRRLLDRNLETLRHQMRGRVLEIGCGRGGRRGRFRPPAKEAEAWIYLDLQDRAQPHLRGDVEHLPLQDAIFDTVICLEVMEYVTHPQAALKEIYRILKRGGTLILATPFLHRADTSHDYWRFTEHALRHLLAEAGFVVQELKAQGAALAVAVNILKYAIYAMQRRRWRYGVALVAYLPLMALLRFDESFARRLPVLRTFSTGYLVLGRAL